MQISELKIDWSGPKVEAGRILTILGRLEAVWVDVVCSGYN